MVGTSGTVGLLGVGHSPEANSEMRRSAMSKWASRCGIIGKPKPSFYRSPNFSPSRFQSHNPNPIPMQPRMAAMWQKMLSPSSGDSAYRPLYSRYCRYMRDAAPRTININGDNIIMKASMTPMIGFKKETILIIVILRDYLFYLQRSSPLSTLLCSALFSAQHSYLPQQHSHRDNHKNIYWHSLPDAKHREQCAKAK